MCIRDSTITQVTGNDQPTTTTRPLSGGSGTYTLNLNQVADKKLKDTYQVMLSVDNGQYESPSTDSFPLYVYNADALQIVNSEDKPITELTLDNTSKVDGDLPTDTQDILSMRQELGLLEMCIRDRPDPAGGALYPHCPKHAAGCAGQAGPGNPRG